MLSLSRSLENLNVEVEERFNSTPLKVFTMLPEVLEDGAVMVDFYYTTSIFGEWLTANIDGSVKLLSNTIDRNFALEAEVGAYGQTFDIEAYMNRERLALGIQLISDDYLGITYDTFRDDVKVFGNLVGLSTQEMDMLADIVDQINAFMNIEEASEEDLEPYIEVLTDFSRNLKVTSRRTQIETGTEQIRCTEIKFMVTKDAILSLLIDMYNLIKDDDMIRDQFDIFDEELLQDVYGSNVNSYDEFLREYKGIISEFKRNYSGDIEVIFYVGSEDRLLRVETIADIEYDGEASVLRADIDFGNSKNDTWTMSSRYIDGDNEEMLSILWDFEERSGKYVNTIKIIPDDPINSVTLVSEWNERSGDFILAYVEGRERNELAGVFTTNDKNFSIKLDDIFPEDSGDSLIIEISTEIGVQINEISYTNIDRWGSTLIERVMSMILSEIFF